MAKLIAGINMTLDGFCDHTLISPDEEIHQHYTDLLNDSGLALYGSKTYQLMQFWQTLIENPSGEKEMDDFAMAIDRIPKIVFSRKLKTTGWESAILANEPLKETVQNLKQMPSKDVLVGSPSLIISLTQLSLIDEYQLCVHPVIAGKGLALFKGIEDKLMLKLIKTKNFKSGALILYYEPIKI